MMRINLILVFALAMSLPSYSLAQAAPKAPVSLCIDNAGCTADNTPMVKGIKWHPGHYVDTDTIDRPDPADPRNVSLSVLRSIDGTPFEGALIRYYWATLEPTKGGYDFSRIRLHRDTLAAIGKRLIVQIQDRTFSGNGPPAATQLPSYLIDGTNSAYAGGWAPRGDNVGIAPKLWIAAVMDREIALQSALAAEFDDDPWVEIVSFEETSLFNLEPSGYTRSAMTTQYHRLADAMSASWSQTTVCIPTNFFHGLEALRDLIDYFASKRICVGGPDNIPGSKTSGSVVISGSFDGVDRRNRTAIFFHNEYNSLTRGFTLQQLQDNNYNVNGSHYTTWARAEPANGLSFSKDIQPWIIARNPPTRTKCPDNYKTGCVTAP